MDRKLVLDTETTGVSIKNGDRIIEIGIVELIDHKITEQYYHQFTNPERQISSEAIAVHGIENEFVQDKPIFQNIATELLEFIQDSPLIIHNASFDMSFLNYELKLINHPPLNNEIIDTLLLARTKYPGSPANLNALCRRFNIDLSQRVKHGALLDAELLALVYQKLISSDKKYELDLKPKTLQTNNITHKEIEIQYRNFEIPAEDLAAHKTMLENIPNNLWQNHN